MRDLHRRRRLSRPLVRGVSLVAAACVGLTAVGLAASPATAGDAPARSATLSERVERVLQRTWGGMPGGVVAGIWLPDGRSGTAAIGVADIDTRRAMRPGLQMPIGSTTKTLTGALVMQQVERGTIRLDDRLARWYPEIPLADEITVAMLLNMSSGIADYANEQLAKIATTLGGDPHHRFDIDQLIAEGAALPRVFERPGERFAYSNTNTTLLGRILEKVTGRTLDQQLSRELLGPLGMSRTFMLNAGGLRAPYAQSYSIVWEALDGAELGPTTQWSGSWGWAAGGLASTIDDLRAWGQALGTGEQVMTAKTARSRLHDCVEVSRTDRIVSSYCLGVVVDRDRASDDVLTLWHNGRTFGAVSYLGYYPRTGAIVGVQGNTDVENAAGSVAAMAVKTAIDEAMPRLLGLR